MDESLKRVTEIFPHMMRSYHSVSSAFSRSMDIPLNHMRVLINVDYMGSCTLVKLSSALGMAASTASEIVDKMVNEGYLKRELNEKNRRQVIISVGQKGKKFIEDFHRKVKEHFRNIFKIITPSNRERFRRAYEILYEISKDIDEHKKHNKTGKTK
ncbi:MarR family winged helix-turn-helix transcriptional regulator [bacterium]|jgi:DNA-binding MarR family transcriptional regulator|nr:MarR family winged helix-turn-helix transcriptional regulator [bacterium]